MDALTVAIEIAGAVGISGIISGIVLRRLNTMDKKMQSRAERRIEESILIMRGLRSCGNLAEATAEAVKTGHANGEVSAAEKEHRRFVADMDAYLMQQNAERNR